MFEFYVSKDTEKQKLMDMFCVKSIGFPMEKRARQYQFPLELAQKMYTLPRYQWDKELEDYLTIQYSKHDLEMCKARRFFIDFWQQNGQEYEKPLKEFFHTELPMYRVLLACHLDVISNWSEPNIVINYKQYQQTNPLYFVYALLFETVLSHVFIRIKKQKNERELPDETLWGLSELSSCVLLNRLYPPFHNSRLTGYPQLDSHIDDFRQTTADTANFTEFLNKVVDFKFGS